MYGSIREESLRSDEKHVFIYACSSDCDSVCALRILEVSPPAAAAFCCWPPAAVSMLVRNCQCPGSNQLGVTVMVLVLPPACLFEFTAGAAQHASAWVGAALQFAALRFRNGCCMTCLMPTCACKGCLPNCLAIVAVPRLDSHLQLPVVPCCPPGQCSLLTCRPLLRACSGCSKTTAYRTAGWR